MSLEWFQCPDGKIIPVKECLNYPPGSCRFEERCLTYPTLAKIAEEREWTGEPSTTQSLNGTMMEFLKLTKPYVIDPDSRIFSLAGTMHHAKLESMAKELDVASEVALTNEDRDIIDLLVPLGDGTWAIYDYKNWGSYRVAKALGLVEVGKKPDPTGAVYKTSGKWGKAGEPKQVSVFQAMPQEVDNWEAEHQLNNYRLKAQRKFNITISKLRAQATVRDGGLQVAQSRGIARNAIMIPIRILPDDEVDDYFTKKRSDLLKALADGKWDTPCSEKECWDGNRCKGYCEVARYCPKGILYQQGGS